MQSKELLKSAIESALQITFPLLEDLRDAPLASPAANGGNHPLWLAGHMAQGTGQLIWEVMRGKPNPLADWNSLFSGGTQPHTDDERYPSYDDVLSKFRAIHNEALVLLDSLSEQDLDQTSKRPPAGFEAFFGTYRQCFLALALHVSNHRGQLAACRRALGRQALLA